MIYFLPRVLFMLKIGFGKWMYIDEQPVGDWLK
jgi:hypothetical protein